MLVRVRYQHIAPAYRRSSIYTAFFNVVCSSHVRVWNKSVCDSPAARAVNTHVTGPWKAVVDVPCTLQCVALFVLRVAINCYL